MINRGGDCEVHFSSSPFTTDSNPGQSIYSYCITILVLAECPHYSFRALLFSCISWALTETLTETRPKISYLSSHAAMFSVERPSHSLLVGHRDKLISRVINAKIAEPTGDK